MMKNFIFMFGLLALVNAAPQPYGPYNGTYPYPPYRKSHENTKDKREANPDPIHPSIHTSDGIDKRITEPEQTHTKYENTKDKREANPEAWDLQEEDVPQGEPRRRVHARWNRTTEPEQPAKHENTKDKREAIPDHVRQFHAGAYAEPTNSYAGYPCAHTDPAYPCKYERREKREVLRHPDVTTIDVPDYFDFGVGYGAPPAVYERLGKTGPSGDLFRHEREKREEHRYPGYQIAAAADYLDYDMDMDEAPKPYRDAAGFSNPSGQAVRRAREFQPADYPDYEPRWPGKQA